MKPKPYTEFRLALMIENEFYTCSNIEDGKCVIWWKHPECETIRQILFAITKDHSYLREREEIWMEYLKDL
jgi:hypothetical protein